MLIFVAGLNVELVSQRVSAVLQQVGRPFDNLDVAKEYAVRQPRAFVQLLATPLAMSAPSCPVVADACNLCCIAGSAVDPLGRFNPMHAGELARHFALSTELEGQFVALRLSANAFELVNDPLGVFPVFVLRYGDGYLLSSSATALALLGDIGELDPLGVSLFVARRWVGADRTLIAGVTTLPGGQYWRWQDGRLTQSRYYHYLAAVTAPQAPAVAPVVATCGRQLSAQLKQLAQQTPQLQLPISGGRDSRVIVALSLAAGVADEALYFTAGGDGWVDVQIGKAIAHRLGLKHRHDVMPPEVFNSRWGELAERVVSRNDGLVTLEHLRNALETVRYPYLPMMLYGNGGEIGRGYYHFGTSCWSGSGKRMVRLLYDQLMASEASLVTADALELARAEIERFVAEHLAQGVAPQDLPDLYYLLEDTCRWGGAQHRQPLNVFEVFSPFATRPYVAATFALSAPLRVMEVLPLELIRSYAPTLLELPFDKPLMPQTLAALRRRLQRKQVMRGFKALARTLGIAKLKRRRPVRPVKERGPNEERAYWFEEVRQEVLAICLDEPNSPLWGYVARPRFEALMRTPDARHRHGYISQLYKIATVFYYRRYLRAALAKARTVQLPYVA